MDSKEKYKAILIFGMPGSGKGTQAKILVEDKKYLHFSTGKMFRNLNEDPKLKETQIAKKITSLISGGNYVPDNLTIELFYKTLEEYVKKENFNKKEQFLLLDGIPRTINQVDLIKEKIEVVKIIYLFCENEQEMVNRLVKRAQEEGRTDDKEEIIKKRFEIYKKDTEAVLKKYSADKIIRINAVGSIENIHSEIVLALAKTI